MWAFIFKGLNKMAKLTVSRINYMKANIHAFYPLTYILAEKDTAPEVKTPERKYVFNTIDSCDFLRNFGDVSATIRAQHNGDNSIIAIEIFYQSRNKTLWTNYTIYLKTAEIHCYDMGI